jgi:hypothetical protein
MADALRANVTMVQRFALDRLVQNEDAGDLPDSGLASLALDHEAVLLLAKSETGPGCKAESPPDSLWHDQAPGRVNGSDLCHDARC